MGINRAEGDGGVVSRGGTKIPIGEAGDAVAEVAARLILGVYEDLDVDLGKLLGEAVAEVPRELVVVAKGRLAALVVRNRSAGLAC